MAYLDICTAIAVVKTKFLATERAIPHPEIVAGQTHHPTTVTFAFERVLHCR